VSNVAPEQVVAEPRSSGQTVMVCGHWVCWWGQEVATGWIMQVVGKAGHWV
jgi:hypothetical protein